MKEKERFRKKLELLALCRANDAVGLAMGGMDGPDSAKGLNLAAVTEFKRNANGTVEIRFIDRIAALKWLAETADEEDRLLRARELFSSLETQAGELEGE